MDGSTAHRSLVPYSWMQRSTFKSDRWGILPRKSCPKARKPARISIRAYGFPAPASSHLEAETLMDLSAALRQVRSLSMLHTYLCLGSSPFALCEHSSMKFLRTSTLVLFRIQRSPATMSCRPPDGSMIQMGPFTTTANTICELHPPLNTSSRCPGFWGKPSPCPVQGLALIAQTATCDKIKHLHCINAWPTVASHLHIVLPK